MRGKARIGNMTQTALQTGATVIKQPLLELCGEHRVLIEQHKGIVEYSSEIIDIKVRFGSIRIGGSELGICSMTADQLVITGNISNISLLKGGDQ